MATRKQRRRRAKEMRHEYEVVYLDSEGNELEPDEVEEAKPSKAPSAKSSSKKPSRAVREPKPPSWSRAARRGAIFMPILVGVVLLTNRNNTTALGIVVIALIFTGLVIPFGYFTDYIAWRTYQKRMDRKPSGPKRPGGTSSKSAKR